MITTTSDGHCNDSAMDSAWRVVESDVWPYAWRLLLSGGSTIRGITASSSSVSQSPPRLPVVALRDVITGNEPAMRRAEVEVRDAFLSIGTSDATQFTTVLAQQLHHHLSSTTALCHLQTWVEQWTPWDTSSGTTLSDATGTTAATQLLLRRVSKVVFAQVLRSLCWFFLPRQGEGRIGGPSTVSLETLSTTTAAMRCHLPVQHQCRSRHQYYYASGCTAIDALLSLPLHGLHQQREGGFPAGQITEICGEAGTGKTHLTLQVLCMAAALEAHRAILHTLILRDCGSGSPLAQAGMELQEWSENVFGAMRSTASPIGDAPSETSPSSALVLLVAEDVPAARLSQLASTAVDCRIHQFFECSESPLAAGKFPVSVVQRWRREVQEQLTTHMVLSRLLVRSLRGGVRELFSLLAPGGPLSTLMAASSGGVLALDTIAAAVEWGDEQGVAAEHDDDDGSDNSGRTSGVARNGFVAAIGSQLRHLCESYHTAVLINNQIRSVWLAPAGIESSDGGVGSNSGELSAASAANPSPLRLCLSPRQYRRRARGVEGLVTTPLGLTWAVVPHIRCQLHRRTVGEKLYRYLRLRSAAYRQRGSIAYFTLTHAGVEDEPC